jgi:hypothetical protein
MSAYTGAPVQALNQAASGWAQDTCDKYEDVTDSRPDREPIVKSEMQSAQALRRNTRGAASSPTLTRMVPTGQRAITGATRNTMGCTGTIPYTAEWKMDVTYAGQLRGTLVTSPTPFTTSGQVGAAVHAVKSTRDWNVQ